MSWSELLSVWGIELTVAVFVAGFASVRLHAHRDRAIARYETVIDRLVETSQNTVSFPRPSELDQVGRVIAMERGLDPGARMSRALVGFAVSAVWATGAVWFTIWGRIESIGSGQAAFRVAVGISILLLALGIGWLTRSDFRWVDQSLAEFEQSSLPHTFQLACDAYAEGRGDESAGLFESVNRLLPRWPWGLLGWAVAVGDGGGNAAFRRVRLDEIMALLHPSRDPVDVALFVATCSLAGKGLAVDAKQRRIVAEIRDQPDMEVLSQLGLLGGGSA